MPFIPFIALKLGAMKFGICIMPGFIMPGIGINGMPGIPGIPGIANGICMPGIIGKFMFCMFCIILDMSGGMNWFIAGILVLVGAVVVLVLAAGESVLSMLVVLANSFDFCRFMAGAASAFNLSSAASEALRFLELVVESAMLDAGDLLPGGLGAAASSASLLIASVFTCGDLGEEA